MDSKHRIFFTLESLYRITLLDIILHFFFMDRLSFLFYRYIVLTFYWIDLHNKVIVSISFLFYRKKYITFFWKEIETIVLD